MIFESILDPVDLSYNGNAVAGLFEKSKYLADPRYADCELYVDAASGTAITVAQLKSLVGKYAYFLQHSRGVARGDVVALFMPNNLYTPVIHLAVISLGAIVSPANVMYSPEELAHQFRVAAPKLAIVYDPLAETAHKAADVAAAAAAGNCRPKIVSLSETVKDLEALRRSSSTTTTTNSSTASPVEVDALETPAYYCFSSGTSGVAKCVITTHKNILSNAIQYHNVNPSLMGPQIGVSCVLPLSHIFALQTSVWGCPFVANRVVVFAKFDLEEFVSGVVKYKLNLLYLVPPIILLLGKLDILNSYPQFNDIVKYIVSGAAPISSDTIGLFNSKCPKPRVVQGYGLTETSPVTHIGLATTKYKYDESSIGWLVPGACAKLVDFESGKEVDGFNKRGELLVRGPMVMRGYLNNESANKEAFSSDGCWFKTGDVAIVTKDHQFYIVDRIKELIKSNGHQVAPAELESILLSNPAVADAAVIGVYNESKTSENPRAYVALTKGADPVDVVKWFNKRVAKHKRLWGGLVVVDQVPKSPSGKILRRELRDRAKTNEDAVLGLELASL